MSGILIIGICLPLLTAPIVYWMGRSSRLLRDVVTTLVCVASLLCMTGAAATAAETEIVLCGIRMHLSAQGFGAVLLVLCAVVFPLSSLAAHDYFAERGPNGTICGEEPHTSRYQAFFLITFGGLLGVFASRDLFATYLFFEIMSLSSWVWVAQEETPESRKAADTYLAVAVIGGLALLYGVLSLQSIFGTVAFTELAKASGTAQNDPRVLTAGICMLVGFGAKAGMYPLHIWLPKAHPVAPAPASALLSGILTKAGIFGILVCVTGLFRGDVRFAAILLICGGITMVLGAVLALASNNLKRLLACSSLSQIGFILVACAVLGLDQETAFAAGGALLHAVNHALIKLILFVCAGVVYRQNHTLDLNRLRGAGRGNLPLLICFAAGALAIAGVPGFSGYISKTLIHEAIVENIAVTEGLLRSALKVTEWLFLLSGGMTLAYMLKVFVRLFVQRGSCRPVQLGVGTTVAVTLPAVLLLLGGILPHATMERIAGAAADSLGTVRLTAHYFSPESLQGAGISIAVGAIVYLVVVRRVLTERATGDYRVVQGPVSLEDHVYRPLLEGLGFAAVLCARFVYSIVDWLIELIYKVLLFARPARWQPKEDDHFAHYSRKYVQFGRIPQTLAFELLLFGIGVVITLLYLLIF